MAKNKWSKPREADEAEAPDAAELETEAQADEAAPEENPEEVTDQDVDEEGGESAVADAEKLNSVQAVDPEPFNLNARVVKALQVVTGQEKVHALNQVELLTGRLKIALPAAIDAVDDAELRSALSQLLNTL